MVFLLCFLFYSPNVEIDLIFNQVDVLYHRTSESEVVRYLVGHNDTANLLFGAEVFLDPPHIARQLSCNAVICVADFELYHYESILGIYTKNVYSTPAYHEFYADKTIIVFFAVESQSSFEAFKILYEKIL